MNYELMIETFPKLLSGLGITLQLVTISLFAFSGGFQLSIPEQDVVLHISFWHATETEKAYNLRYLLVDGTQITEADYTTRKSNGENVYKAAFVGCTYHCG